MVHFFCSILLSYKFVYRKSLSRQADHRTFWALLIYTATLPQLTSSDILPHTSYNSRLHDWLLYLTQCTAALNNFSATMWCQHLKVNEGNIKCIVHCQKYPMAFQHCFPDTAIYLPLTIEQPNPASGIIKPSLSV